MLRRNLFSRFKLFPQLVNPSRSCVYRTLCTPNNYISSLDISKLTDAERAGRDLAKLAKLTSVLRQTIQKTAHDLNPPADHLLMLEQEVNEAVNIIKNTLHRVGHPCDVEELGDRIDRNIVPIPADALDYRDFLRAQALRDTIEEMLVSLEVFPPQDAWLDGAGKLFDRHDRKKLRKEREEEIKQINVDGNMPSIQEEQELKELRPVSEEELERRKAYFEKSTTMEEVLRGYDTALLQVGRVHKVVKGGTTSSMRALVAIGNRRGTAGYGEGKSDTAQHAVERACRDAKRNLLNIDLHQGRTIYHRVKGEFVVSEVSLWPAPRGTGISANNNFAIIFELFGMKDIGAKLHGSRSLSNAVKALFNALSRLQTPESVARARGLQEIVRPRWTPLPRGKKKRKFRFL